MYRIQLTEINSKTNSPKHGREFVKKRRIAGGGAGQEVEVGFDTFFLQFLQYLLRDIFICIFSGGEYKNIVIMCGAGISVNAGIPDFRSPSAGGEGDSQPVKDAAVIFQFSNNLDILQKHAK